MNIFRRLYTMLYPPIATVSQDSKPIKFGILGAATIGPNAIIGPAKSHAEALIYAVAARNQERATAYAKKHGIQKAYGGATGYQEMLDDPEVDAIYNALPNGLHYEWTVKALLAGKHVLLEKPATDIAEEARHIFDLAESKKLVVLEAVHYRFHPATLRMKAIIDSGELGAIKHVTAKLMLPKSMFPDDDIRFNKSLGGGAMMDVGCYVLSCLRYFTSSNPISVIEATHIPHVASTTDVDRYTKATLAFPNNVTGTLEGDLAIPPLFGFISKLPQISVKMECETGDVELYNFVLPTYYHTLTVNKIGAGGKKEKRVEKVYTFAEGGMDGKGEAWWTTYRFQLEAFVDRVKGRVPRVWIEKEETIGNMEWIEKIYETTGFGARPKSEYILPEL